MAIPSQVKIFAIVTLALMSRVEGQQITWTECPETCENIQCPTPQGCLAGLVKDPCDCCFVCGNREGYRCWNETIEGLPKEYMKYGFCGHELLCRLRDDLDQGDPIEAVCVCEENEPMCGSDGVTYENKCQLTGARYSHRTGLVPIRRGPCRAPPKIVSPPEAINNKTGTYVAFACEAIGWPVPSIEWRVATKSDILDQDPDELDYEDAGVRMLPSDDPHIAVQSRGGPASYEVTGWLQIMDLQPKDEGSYFCVARNEEGVATAKAHLTVSDSKQKRIRNRFKYPHSDPLKDNEVY